MQAEQIHQLQEQLYTGQPLTTDQSQTLFGAVVAGEVDPIILSSVLTAMKVRGETTDEIAGAARAMLDAAVPFPKPDYPVADSCGTGGDCQNTINISTASAFVAAACGLKMVKHGNRSVSSKSGSSDLLAAFGINLNPTPEKARECLDQLGVCFLFAPQYHGGVRHAMPVRQTLKTRTLFNVLGPLINPSRPEVQLMGVYDPALCRPIAETLQKLGVKRAMVVHGSGLDEIALHGSTKVVEIHGDELKEYEVNPTDFGLTPQPIEALRGGDAEHNKVLIEAILKGQGELAHRQAVAINVAALLYLHDKADSFKEATQLAMDSMTSGQPLNVLQSLAELSHQD